MKQKQIQLRDYQFDAIVNLWDYWRQGRGTAPLIVAPTGAGKSILIAEIIQRVIKNKPTVRFAMVTHVKELIEQNLEALQIPSFMVGICCAGLGRVDVNRRITLASVQTACRHDLGHIDLLIIDEAHLIPRKAKSMYGQLIANLRQTNQLLRIVGFTATPYRLDSGLLIDGPDAVFDGIAHSTEICDLIKRGYLVRPITSSNFEMDNLQKQRGEFTAKSQSKSLSQNLYEVISDIVHTTHDKRTLIFCPQIEMAEKIAEMLDEEGLDAASVSSRNSDDDRRDIIDRFKTGKLTHLTNVNLLTTGSNIPEIEAVCLCRATTSPGLYVQMVGRGLRTAPGKTECLVRDYGGNALRLGPIGFPKIKDKTKAPARICEKCMTIIPPQGPCPQCGHAQPVPEHFNGAGKSDDTTVDLFKSFQGDIVGWDHPPEMLQVDMVGVEPWKAQSGKMTLVLQFVTEPDSRNQHRSEQHHRLWLCPEHTGFARKKFIMMWHDACDTKPPDTVAEAIIRIPQEWPFIDSIVTSKKSGSQWQEITKVNFAETGSFDDTRDKFVDDVFASQEPNSEAPQRETEDHSTYF